VPRRPGGGADAVLPAGRQGARAGPGYADPLPGPLCAGASRPAALGATGNQLSAPRPEPRAGHADHPWRRRTRPPPRTADQSGAGDAGLVQPLRAPRRIRARGRPRAPRPHAGALSLLPRSWLRHPPQQTGHPAPGRLMNGRDRDADDPEADEPEAPDGAALDFSALDIPILTEVLHPATDAGPDPIIP